MADPLPLQGLRVLERSRGVAAAFAGRMLAGMGAEVTMLEPAGGHALRREAPSFADGSSAAFAYLSDGKRLVAGEAGLEGVAALIDDTPMAERAQAQCPGLVYVSVLPFGCTGPKAGWAGEELTLAHAGGEANLLPNGLTLELFPDRPPLKMFGNFVLCQAGVAAALGASAALLGPVPTEGVLVDVSVQDVAVGLGAMAVQRLGDGVLEHRTTRSFRYGGVFQCRDGYIEMVTAEERQWQALVKLLGSPAWAGDPALADPIERGRRGAEINRAIRAWSKDRDTAEIVEAGQKLGVPVAKYRGAQEVLAGAHERERGLFAPADVPGQGRLPLAGLPMQLDGRTLHPGAVRHGALRVDEAA